MTMDNLQPNINDEDIITRVSRSNIEFELRESEDFGDFPLDPAQDSEDVVPPLNEVSEEESNQITRRRNRYIVSRMDSVKVGLKLLGVTIDELKRWSALKRLGITNEEYELGISIMSTVPIFKNNKIEKLTGFAMSQIKRRKALSVLGITEEDIERERAASLSQIGKKPSLVRRLQKFSRIHPIARSQSESSLRRSISRSLSGRIY